MIKQFPKKLIREKKYPRCHYTKKRGKLKPKKPYNSLQAAEDFIKKHYEDFASSQKTKDFLKKI